MILEKLTWLVNSVTSGGSIFFSSCSRANDSIAEADLAPSYMEGLSLSAPNTKIVGKPSTLNLLMRDWYFQPIRSKLRKVKNQIDYLIMQIDVS